MALVMASMLALMTVGVADEVLMIQRSASVAARSMRCQKVAKDALNQVAEHAAMYLSFGASPGFSRLSTRDLLKTAKRFLPISIPNTVGVQVAYAVQTLLIFKEGTILQITVRAGTSDSPTQAVWQGYGLMKSGVFHLESSRAVI